MFSLMHRIIWKCSQLWEKLTWTSRSFSLRFKKFSRLAHEEICNEKESYRINCSGASHHACTCLHYGLHSADRGKLITKKTQDGSLHRATFNQFCGPHLGRSGNCFETQIQKLLRKTLSTLYRLSVFNWVNITVHSNLICERSQCTVKLLRRYIAADRTRLTHLN